jgi:hypothetical protein
VRSSISNSKAAYSELTQLGLALLVFAVAFEVFWRSRGFEPAPSDDVRLWSVHRRKLADQPEALVLAGSSRFHSGLSVNEFRQFAPGKQVVQLSVSGGSPLGLLSHLAQDPSFRGLVLCEVIPHLYFADLLPWEPWPGLSQRAFSSRWEDALRVETALHSTLALPDLRLDRLWASIRDDGQLPLPSVRKVTMAREVLNDYRNLDVTSLELKQARDYAKAGRELDTAGLTSRIGWIRDLVDKIQLRGGRVVFFRMISSGSILEIEDRRFPDSEYWDAFVRGCGAPAVHFREIPALGSFRCPEGSHLDHKDMAAFTRALAHEFRSRDLL